MEEEYLIPILMATHGLCFMLGGVYYVNVYVKAYKKQKEKNKRIIDAIQNAFK